MKTLIRSTLLLLLSLIIVIVVSCFVIARFNTVSAGLKTECVQLTWHRSSICQSGTNYSAGMNQVMLAGNALPTNASLDGKYFRLSGYLIDTGTCTVFVVQQAKSCQIPTINAPATH